MHYENFGLSTRKDVMDRIKCFR